MECPFWILRAAFLAVVGADVRFFWGAPFIWINEISKGYMLGRKEFTASLLSVGNEGDEIRRKPNQHWVEA